MTSKINYSPYYYLNSGHKSLLDYGLEIDGKTKDEKLFKISQNQNMLHDFAELTYNCAKWVLPKYSNYHSNHLYDQHQLFTILAFKLI